MQRNVSDCNVMQCNENSCKAMRVRKKRKSRRRKVDAETLTPKRRRRNIDAETSTPKRPRRGILSAGLNARRQIKLSIDWSWPNDRSAEINQSIVPSIKWATKNSAETKAFESAANSTESNSNAKASTLQLDGTTRLRVFRVIRFPGYCSCLGEQCIPVSSEESWLGLGSHNWGVWVS